MFKVNNKNTRTTSQSMVLIVDFEQINVSWTDFQMKLNLGLNCEKMVSLKMV